MYTELLVSNFEPLLEEAEDQHQKGFNGDDRDLPGDEDGGRESAGRRGRQGSARPRTAKRPPSALQRGDKERRGGGKASELDKRRENVEVNTPHTKCAYSCS